MGVSNSIAKKENALATKECKFMAGNSEVTLTAATVKNYLVSGDADKVTTQEVVMFINLCKYQGLNPFLREAYLVKYGNNAAQLIAGKAAFETRAERNEKYKGCEAGVIVRCTDKHIEYREGTLVLDDEQLVGGWAKVYVDGYEKPVYASANLREYNTGKSIWASKPATMIRKVAKVQALREAFPSNFSGMYAEEEMQIDEPLSDVPVDPVQVQENTIEKQTKNNDRQQVIIETEPEILDGSDLL